MFAHVFSNIGVILIVIIFGAIAGKAGLLGRESRDGITKLVISLTIPLLYFYILAGGLDKELIVRLWVLPLAAVALIFYSWALGRGAGRLLKLNADERKTFTYLCTFSNCGFLAIPIAFAAFGKEGVLRVVIYNLGLTPLLWTLGVWILSGKGRYGNLRNPGIVAMCLGIAVGVSSISLPEWLIKPISLIGNSSIPLALLVVGAMLSAGFGIGSKISKSVMAALIGIRLIIIPLTALVVTSFFGWMDPLVRAIIVLQAAMPSASTTPIFVKRFGGDAKLAGAGVFFTTLLSILTVSMFLTAVAY